MDTITGRAPPSYEPTYLIHRRAALTSSMRYGCDVRCVDDFFVFVFVCYVCCIVELNGGVLPHLNLPSATGLNAGVTDLRHTNYIRM